MWQGFAIDDSAGLLRVMTMFEIHENPEKIWEHHGEPKIYNVEINRLDYKVEPEMTIREEYITEKKLNQKSLIVTLKERDRHSVNLQNDYDKGLYKLFIDEKIEYLILSRAWLDGIEESYKTGNGRIEIIPYEGITYSKGDDIYRGPFALDELLKEGIGVNIVGFEMPYRLSEANEKLYLPLGNKKDKIYERPIKIGISKSGRVVFDPDLCPEINLEDLDFLEIKENGESTYMFADDSEKRGVLLDEEAEEKLSEKTSLSISDLMRMYDERM